MTNSSPLLSALSEAQFRQKLDEALDLVLNEFRSLDADQQYRNSFARLLKWDPLERVTMLGTDQRDQLIPVLRKCLAEHLVRQNGQAHIFDAGGGDGQTFGLVADGLPEGTVVSMLDPNAHYVESYHSLVTQHPILRVGEALVMPMDDYHPQPQSYDAVLCIHSLYFFSSLQDTLAELYQSLKPDGILFIVFADESQSYTGHCVRRFYNACGLQQELEDHNRNCAERITLLIDRDSTPAAIKEELDQRFPEYRCQIDSELQSTRLFGNSLSDILAICNITELSGIEDWKKFETTSELLRESPDVVGLRVEQQGSRLGMLSVLQQQVVVRIGKKEMT